MICILSQMQGLRRICCSWGQFEDSLWVQPLMQDAVIEAEPDKGGIHGTEPKAHKSGAGRKKNKPSAEPKQKQRV